MRVERDQHKAEEWGSCPWAEQADKPVVTCRQPCTRVTPRWRNAKLSPAQQPPSPPAILASCPPLAHIQPTNLERRCSARVLQDGVRT